MKKLLFKETRCDKNNINIKYEAGKEYEFEDKRADEILKSGVASIVENVEKVVESANENVETVETVSKPKRSRKTVKKD